MNTFRVNSPVSILKTRRLPHWSQAGTLTFITWRTRDSIPRNIYMQWREQRDQWLVSRGIDPDTNDGSSLKNLTTEDQQYFDTEFSTRWNNALDACYGTCPLRNPKNSQIVFDSLKFFDGDLYELDSFVVMPNHVHLICAFPDTESMLKQCTSWKHYTATHINKRTGNCGRFWQQDAFDYLVRSPVQLEKHRRYITDNPKSAKLRTGEFRIWAR